MIKMAKKWCPFLSASGEGVVECQEKLCFLWKQNETKATGDCSINIIADLLTEKR